MRPLAAFSSSGITDGAEGRDNGDIVPMVSVNRTAGQTLTCRILKVLSLCLHWQIDSRWDQPGGKGRPADAQAEPSKAAPRSDQISTKEIPS